VLSGLRRFIVTSTGYAPQSGSVAFDEADAGEEIANAITHGIAAALALAALTILVVLASVFGDGWHLASSIVFGLSLLLLYLASTLYHALPFPRAKRVFKILDHAAIYLLIAGTYTPFTLVTLRHAGGWWLFGLIWGLAMLGIVLEAGWVHRPRWLNAVIFVAMGWLVLAMRAALVAHLSPPGLWLLIAGGITYTTGTIFYISKRPYMHAVWHLFVIGGSLLHFLAVLLYVLPWR
jgi:hemolysin III